MTDINLPKEWIDAQLGAFNEIQSGIGFPKTFQGRVSGVYPVYKVGDVSRSVLNAKGKLAIAENYVDESDVKQLRGVVFQEGTTLFAKIGEAVRLNRRAYVTKKGLADNNVMGVKPFFNEMDKFVHYFLKTVELGEASRSTTVPSIRKSDIEEIEIPFPPLAEQQQIAQKLDELLAQVDTLKTRLDAIPKILKRFRQSVLAAAVSGRLTEEWRGEMNSENWISVELLDVVQTKPRNSFSPQGVEYETQVKNLTLSATTSGVFKHDKYKYVDIEISDDSYLWLEPDDILIQRANSLEYVGVSAIYTGKAKTYTYPDLMMKCRANEKVLTKFLHYSLSSSSARKYFRENATGTTGNMPKINQGVVCSLPINLPSIQEQVEIVRRVEQFFAYADQIEQRVKDAQARVNHLTQSILAKAFRGELTAEWRAQNPELISGENSAAALLERIKVEQDRAVKSKRKVKA